MTQAGTQTSGDKPAQRKEVQMDGCDVYRAVEIIHNAAKAWDIEDDIKGALVELVSAKELADMAVERVMVHGGGSGLDETWRKEAWRIADNAIAAAVLAIRNA